MSGARLAPGKHEQALAGFRSRRTSALVDQCGVVLIPDEYFDELSKEIRYSVSGKKSGAEAPVSGGSKRNYLAASAASFLIESRKALFGSSWAGAAAPPGCPGVSNAGGAP